MAFGVGSYFKNSMVGGLPPDNHPDNNQSRANDFVMR